MYTLLIMYVVKINPMYTQYAFDIHRSIYLGFFTCTLKYWCTSCAPYLNCNFLLIKVWRNQRGNQKP